MSRAVIYLRVSTREQAETDYSTEGFSIPAQREACIRKAESLGAVVEAEFVDRGESARSADRPALQDMLKKLRQDRSIDYVIVHKLDRLARSLADDVAINLAVRTAGATMVSCTESIDGSPSGRLLHGVVASVAEFYSANLSAEAKKGMRQKAKVGGTPGKAPIGYRNVREIIDGHEIRTIAVDPERAPLVQWAFQTFAAGDHTTRTMHAALVERGLTTKGNRNGGPPKPLSVAKVHTMLRNPYYVGVVVFEGVHYEGRHEALVDMDTFQKVQDIFDNRRLDNDKPAVRSHYLKGSLACARCGSNLGITYAKGRRGGTYPYFYCLGRQRRNGCQLPFLPIDHVEDTLVRFWRTVEPVEDGALDDLRDQLVHHVKLAKSLSAKEVKRQTDRLAQLDRQAEKLLQAHYDDAIPMDLLRREQRRIVDERSQAEKVLAATTLRYEVIEKQIDIAIGRLADCGTAYERGTQRIRRELNHVLFRKLYIDDEGVAGVDLTELYTVILDEQLPDRLAAEADLMRAGRYDEPIVGSTESGAGKGAKRHTNAGRSDSTPWPSARHRLERPSGDLFAWETKNPVHGSGRGLNERALVGAEGLEPPTNAL